MINLSPVSTTPPITANPWQRLIADVVDTGDKFVSGVGDTTEQFIAGVLYTADKHSFAIIFANFQKMILMVYSGAVGTLIHEKKNEVENLVSDSL